MFAAKNFYMVANSGVSQPTIKGASVAQSGSGTAVTTMPSHSVGDLLVLFTSSLDYNDPVAPSSGGTVPSWTTIGSASGTHSNLSYAVATATNHTVGSWQWSYAQVAVVISNQNANPIGGNAYYGQASSTVVAPSVTLSKSDGTSLLLHFGAHQNSNWTSNPPTGYTIKIEGPGGGEYRQCRFVTKNDTKTDGSVNLGSIAGGYTWASASLEIKK